jgi:hypothetical protein
VSNVKARHGSKSTTDSLGSDTPNSDSTQRTVKRSAKSATTKNPPPWLAKRIANAEKDFEVKAIQKPRKEQPYERIGDELKARQASEEEQKARRQEVLNNERAHQRRVDELKKGGATHSKAFGR